MFNIKANGDMHVASSLTIGANTYEGYIFNCNGRGYFRGDIESNGVVYSTNEKNGMLPCLVTNSQLSNKSPFVFAIFKDEIAIYQNGTYIGMFNYTPAS